MVFKGFIRIGCTVVITRRNVSEHEIIYCKFIILDKLIRTTFVVVPICGPVQSLGTYTGGGPLCPLNTQTSCMIFSQSACCTTNIVFCNALYLLYFHVIQMVLK